MAVGEHVIYLKAKSVMESVTSFELQTVAAEGEKAGKQQGRELQGAFRGGAWDRSL